MTRYWPASHGVDFYNGLDDPVCVWTMNKKKEEPERRHVFSRVLSTSIMKTGSFGSSPLTRFITFLPNKGPRLPILCRFHRSFSPGRWAFSLASFQKMGSKPDILINKCLWMWRGQAKNEEHTRSSHHITHTPFFVSRFNCRHACIRHLLAWPTSNFAWRAVSPNRAICRIITVNSCILMAMQILALNIGASCCDRFWYRWVGWLSWIAMHGESAYLETCG